MTSRERVRHTLEHKEADRVPVGICECSAFGMHASTVYRLRQTLGLDPPGTPVKVLEPYVMVGEIKSDLAAALNSDVVFVPVGTKTAFGFKNEGWKPWTFFDGTPLLVPGCFNTEPEPNGDILMYPQGARSAPASGLLPRGGWYFDSIIRQPPVEDATLNFEDLCEGLAPISDEDLAHLKFEVDRLYEQTDKAILIRFGNTAFGDAVRVTAPFLKHPRGIRDIEEWHISHVTRPDYIYRVFERQCETALLNLEQVYSAVGGRVMVAHLTGTDFGGQTQPLFAPDVYRRLYKPFHKKVNDWVHNHTAWKTLMHSDGSMRALIPDLLEAGFDILNPVQCSAAGMDPAELKREFGYRLVFWGGAVNAQATLPFGNPGEVRKEAYEHLRIFGQGGGYVFGPAHNVQPLVPMENLLAMLGTVREHGAYPLS